ncbi:MAG: hypothetical protein ACRDUY_01560 [Nitriliruptorales bacterium]
MGTVRVELTAVYRTVENDWVQATVREIPGVLTAARTRAQAGELVLDAFREWLLAGGEVARRSRDTAVDHTAAEVPIEADPAVEPAVITITIASTDSASST